MLHCGEVIMPSRYSSPWSYVVLFSLVFSFVCVAISSFQTASAQTKLEFSGASLKLEPAFPEPDTNVKVMLDAYTYDTAGAVIVWKIDGVQRPEFENERSITIPAGKLGDKTSVSATVLALDGSGFTLKKDITPVVLDIIVEAHTYVPPFYRGRALGSQKTDLRVTAIPHNGVTLNPRELTFTWEHNESILFGGPMRGKQSVDITMPQYSGGYVKVSVMNDKRELVVEKRISLKAVKPEMHFYEEIPLRGLSEVAIKERMALIGEETTVHGEPYYLRRGVSAEDLTFKWSVNGEEIVNENSDPHIITLKKTGGSGSALITLRALTNDLIPQYVQNNFNLSF